LHYKSINPFDFVRWFNYYFMLKTGIADTYRNEQFIKKPDFLYNFDYLINKVNLNSSDKEKVAERLIFLQYLLIINIISRIKNFTYYK